MHDIRLLHVVHVLATDLAVPGLDGALRRAIHPSDPALLFRRNQGLAHLGENGTCERIDEK